MPLLENQILRKADVLVAISPSPLLRVIDHLFVAGTGFQVVARPSQQCELLPAVERLRPKLIVANTKFLGAWAGSGVAQLKRTSRETKLILVTNFFEKTIQDTRVLDADAYLEDENLVRQLLPTAQE